MTGCPGDGAEPDVRVERGAPAASAVARARDTPARGEDAVVVRAADGERHDRPVRGVLPLAAVRAQVDAGRDVAGDDLLAAQCERANRGAHGERYRPEGASVVARAVEASPGEDDVDGRAA